MDVLITGGAGFLGQYLVAALSGHGHRVHVADLRPPRHALLDLDKHCAGTAYGVDVTKPEALTGHFDGKDVVFHLAGLISFWRKDRGPLMDVNVGGTRHVLGAAMRAGVRRFVHVSSVAAVGYNDRKDRPIDEDFPFDWSRVPHKHYMVSKHEAEAEVLRACADGLNAVIVNPGLMWGPGDTINSARLIVGIRQGRVPACPPGGTNIVDVRDVAEGLPALIEAGRPGQRYILGGSNVTFREVYDAIAAVLGVRSPRVTLPRALRPLLYCATLANELVRKAPPALTSDNIDSAFMYRYFSSARAERELGWKPRHSFEDTIRDSIAWLAERGMLP